MKNVISKIKKYKPTKYICFLYFFVPFFVCCVCNVFRGNDIWFLLKHGKYVLEYGIPRIEPFTMHSNFSFVMQQWLSSVIFYLVYVISKQYGLLLLIVFVNMLTLFILYKLCMLLSDNKFRLSIVTSIITDIFLLVFVEARPWIFTMLNLVLILYIMELFYKKNKKRALYILPFISLLQINIQSPMWYIQYLFMLPYLVCFLIEKNKNRTDNRYLQLLIVIFIMFLCGFINPYGINNLLYVFNSYGDYYINNYVMEMNTVSLSSDLTVLAYSLLFYFIFISEVLIYIFCKKGKFELRHLFLFLGTAILGLKNLRSIWLFIIGSIPFLAAYLSPYFCKLTPKEKELNLDKNTRKKYYLLIFLLVSYSIICGFVANGNFTNKLKGGIDKIYETNLEKNASIYVNFDNGSYVLYRGLKPYIDTRAEVFLKKNNHKEDIMKEYYLVYNGYISYDEFVNKYKFDYMIIMENERIYDKALKDKNYRLIYHSKKYKYSVFERTIDRK